jgi:histidine triad (HIT) family protein
MADEDYAKKMEEIEKNCPFCKIIKGEIPSRKVYEDDKVVAVLDINPNRKGHTLVMPKNHYPILPLLSAELFSHLFTVTKELSLACAKATANPYSNIFIANGASAGQQSHHFMLHIIPNENKGGFEIPSGKISQSDIDSISESLSSNISRLMNSHIAKNPSFVPEAILKPDNKKIEKENVQNQIDAPSIYADLTVDQIIDVLLNNKEALNVLLSDTAKFKEMIPNHPQLSKMFSKVSVDEVIFKLKDKIGLQQPGFDSLNAEKVVALVMDNPLVRDAMLSDLEKFKQLIPKNETLTKLFAKVSVDDVYSVLKSRVKK